MKIICFGDSLTRGVSVVKGRLRIIKENYPSFLQAFFLSNNRENVEVVNKGVFNDNSDLLMARLTKDVINEKPDYTIIGIGGNDCNFKWNEVAEHPDETHEPIVPIDRYLDNVKTMISIVKDSGITPIIMSMPPLDPVRYYKFIADKYGPSISHWISSLGGIEHWHGLYNRSLNKLVSDIDVIKIDVRTAIKQAGELIDLISDDGIHLTSTGYKALSREVFNRIIKISDLKKPQQI
ncbi:SGNH/GDSL hydrolase family protein [Bacillus sporothermodurans]|uniref:SGNH/GDSL hydrolase family protein n=2 Tax=Heyndrickxia sporothermodurans TaxID=46224 RepID=A0AB37HCD5_9BACI|nr:GDSL-type esterase/lipase family protein [Heyndrickxia sporothermodurans]MBL5772453.1 SGNH/GDSL hydrolase family protein [Heyndrickxia sporothermodurans]MBL5774806.1 SGNH/GDSL hydrolase family protein [Heyndrickxia sporothermodurans]MBL5792736.1 SGNH/GDSL hydrolase family protein [Heyndrickxia sporothermodurans]MBL5796112.1 SGNH/GDSL hydrolase family protein [Heyndrickxia sporothermodurans]MBL5807019.1 SGNH/GDSL hydrolase family protein [Heyndrickxia sporothermodurans]